MQRDRKDQLRAATQRARAKTIRPPPRSTPPPPLSGHAEGWLATPPLPRFSGKRTPLWWSNVDPDGAIETDDEDTSTTHPAPPERVDLDLLLSSTLPPPGSVYDRVLSAPQPSSVDWRRVAVWAGAVLTAVVLAGGGWLLGRAQGRADGGASMDAGDGVFPGAAAGEPEDQDASDGTPADATRRAPELASGADTAPVPAWERGPAAEDTLPPVSALASPGRAGSTGRPREARPTERARTMARARSEERAEPAPASALPATPSRDEVRRAFRAIADRVNACAGPRSGVAKVRVEVASSGRVRQAVVQGPFAGTAQGSCIARAVREAELPAFRRPTLNVVYPFRVGSRAER